MGDVFVLALGAAVYPTLLAVAIILLRQPNPVAQLSIFWLGGMLMSVGIGLAALFALKGSGIVNHSRQGASWGIDLAAGVLCIGGAFVFATERDAPMRERMQARRARRHPPDPEREAKTPFITRTLSGGSLPVAFGIGVLLNLPGVIYLAALKDIANGHHSVPIEVAGVLGFNLIMFTLIEVPLVSYILEPERSRVMVERFNDSTRAHARHIAVVVLAGIGVYLLIKGLSAAIH